MSEIDTIPDKVGDTVHRIPGWAHILIIVLMTTFGTEGAESYLGRDGRVNEEVIRTEIRTQISTQLGESLSSTRASLEELRTTINNYRSDLQSQSNAIRDNRCEIEHLKAGTDWRQCYGPRVLP